MSFSQFSNSDLRGLDGIVIFFLCQFDLKLFIIVRDLGATDAGCRAIQRHLRVLLGKLGTLVVSRIVDEVIWPVVTVVLAHILDLVRNHFTGVDLGHEIVSSHSTLCLLVLFL